MRPLPPPAAAVADPTASSRDTLEPAAEHRLLLLLAGIQFTHIVDFMLMMPLGPQLTHAFGIGDAAFGLLVSAYTFAAGICALVASLFVDRFERKTLLLWSYAGLAGATLLCAVAPSYAWLLAARIAAGVFGGVLGTLVQTIVADVVPFERRGHAMGVVMGSFSLATVAGVPGSLWLAESFGWRAGFVAIVFAVVVFGTAARLTLPRLDDHLVGTVPAPPLIGLAVTLRDPQHWRAFGLTALIMASGFTTIPYLTIVMTTNIGIDSSQVPLIYMAGGVATLFSARLIGASADRWGKVRVFRLITAIAALPVIAITQLGPTPLWALMLVTTLFFVFVSGRLVPGMALITAAADPSRRGSFMSLNSAVQSAAMGAASLLGGLLIDRDASGLVEGYDRAGWVGVALTIVALWWVGQVRGPDRVG